MLEASAIALESLRPGGCLRTRLPTRERLQLDLRRVRARLN
jgi:hypothetical protein